MYIDPGSLNKRIQIVRIYKGKEYDSKGHPVRSEEIIRECWAKVSSTSGTELIRAGVELSDARKRFLVRWTPVPVNAAMVVRYAGEDHGIVYVNRYGDNKDYMEIWTDERKAVS